MNDEGAAVSALLLAVSTCRVAIADNGSLMAALFLTGLTGSVSHCLGMCGPFVLTQMAARLESVPVSQMREWRRWTNAILPAYHLGRTLTYMGLGALAAGLAGKLADPQLFQRLAALLLVGAALVLAAYAFPALRGFAAGSGAWGRMLTGWARPLFTYPTGLRGLVLGLLLGFIPCGLLYGALAAAAASGDALAGAFAMLFFALGTMPVLMLTGWFGQMAALRWRTAAQRIAPVLLLLNAGVLLYLALRLGL